MVNLPDTRPEMVVTDFEGVREALKGKKKQFILVFYYFIICSILELSVEILTVFSIFQLTPGPKNEHNFTFSVKAIL